MMKKLFNLSGNIIIALLIVLSLSSLYSILQTRNNPDQIPSILGYQALTVLSGSMSPSLNPGDLIITKKTDPNSIKVNDVITFTNKENTIITHRIIDLIHKDSEIVFNTKGDANNMEDQDLVSSEQLLGSLQFGIPKAGYIVNFLKSPTGLITVVSLIIIFLTIGVLKKIFTAYKAEQKPMVIIKK